MLKLLIPLLFLRLTIQASTCSRPFKPCGANKVFIWCRVINGKSNTGKYVASGGTPDGVSMHVMHHKTGCNGTPAGQMNYFRGSKAENLAEYRYLENRVLNSVKKTKGCGKIDATGFNVSVSSHGNKTSQGWSTNQKLLYGQGQIKFYTGTKSGANGCTKFILIGTYNLGYKGSKRISSIKTATGIVIKTFNYTIPSPYPIESGELSAFDEYLNSAQII